MCRKEKKLFSVVCEYDLPTQSVAHKYGHSYRLCREKFFKNSCNLTESELERISELVVHEIMTLAGIVILRLNNTVKAIKC